MEIIFEFIAHLIGFIWEIFFQVLIELLANFVSAKLSKPQKPVGPLAAAICYTIFGALAGVLSLLIFPKSFINTIWLRQVNLIITPAVCGLIMSRYGNYKKNHNKGATRLDTFAYGFLFAFAMALVRYLLGQ